MPKYRQEIDEFFDEDPQILTFIDQTKEQLEKYRKDNKFFKDNYNRLIDLLRVRAINRLPKEGTEELDTLVNIKERRYSKLKQETLVKLNKIKPALNKKDNSEQTLKLQLIRNLVSSIIRKFRINF